MSLTEDIYKELAALIQNISQKNMYSGNRIPDSIMKQFEIEIKEQSGIFLSGGILVPYWLPVLQKGRGPRRSNKDSGLVKIIYSWMQKHNIFRSQTAKGKFNEARSITWWINKYGNKHFRSKQFIDIYVTERDKTIEKINAQFSAQINKITMEVI